VGLLQARRPPTGASPSLHSSPSCDLAVRKPSVSGRSNMTPSHLRRRSMSADLERTELCEASLAYPSSPSEQQVRFDTLLFLAVFVSSVVSILCLNYFSGN